MRSKLPIVCSLCDNRFKYLVNECNCPGKIYSEGVAVFRCYSYICVDVIVPFGFTYVGNTGVHRPMFRYKQLHPEILDDYRFASDFSENRLALSEVID